MLRFVTERLQRWRDGVRRRFAMLLWDRPNQQQGSFQNRIVFIRWDAKLGDTIVLSWVFREIKRQRPDLEISVITGESFQELFRRGYGIESVYLAGKRHGRDALKHIIGQIGHPKYVVHLSLSWRPRDLWFVNRLNPQHVVGLDDELDMVDVKLGELTRGRHFSDKLVPWLKDLGIDTSNRNYWIPRLPEAASSVSRWWPEGRVVGLCPFGASRKKHLGNEWIERIVQCLIGYGSKVVVLVLPSQKPLIQALVQKNDWQQSVFMNEGQSTQYELFEQVSRCDAIVSVDTAVVHLANGFGLPLLAFYNSTGEEFENWRPNEKQNGTQNGPQNIVLRCHSDMSQPDNGLRSAGLDEAISKLMADVVNRCSV